MSCSPATSISERNDERPFIGTNTKKNTILPSFQTFQVHRPYPGLLLVLSLFASLMRPEYPRAFTTLDPCPFFVSTILLRCKLPQVHSRHLALGYVWALHLLRISHSFLPVLVASHHTPQEFDSSLTDTARTLQSLCHGHRLYHSLKHGNSPARQCLGVIAPNASRGRDKPSQQYSTPTLAIKVQAEVVSGWGSRRTSTSGISRTACSPEATVSPDFSLPDG